MVSRQPSSTGASHRSRTLTLFAAPASPPMRCAKRVSTIEDLRLCRGSSFDQFSTTKRGTPASQAPQEFQNIYPIPTTTVFIPSTAKSGGLHIVSPQFRQKCNCEKIASYLHKMPCIREPLRAARVVPLFRFEEKHPHAYNCAQKEEEREPQYL